MLKICSIIGFASFGLVLIIYPIWWHWESRREEGTDRNEKLCRFFAPIIYSLLVISMLLLIPLACFIMSDYSSSIQMIVFRVIYMLLGSFIPVISGFLIRQAIAQHSERTRYYIHYEEYETILPAFSLGVMVYVVLLAVGNGYALPSQAM